MTTVIFVHGIGGREENYAQTFQTIENALLYHENLKDRSDIKLESCLWGEVHGAKLKSGCGASIPNYAESEGGVSFQFDLWEKLYQDPLYEILLLSFKPITGVPSVPGKLTPPQELNKKIQKLIDSPNLESQITIAGIADIFNEAHGKIVRSNTYNRLLERVSIPLQEYYEALARAIVAQAMYLLKDRSRYAAILYNTKLRDNTVDCICNELTEQKTPRAGVGDWTRDLFYKGLRSWGNSKFKRERGAITDSIYPFAGDILVYQARGENIRRFIKQKVEEVEPPVVLLAHSLGGIACVELLIEEKMPQINLLITVGSQTPFLYEINALKSLEYEEPLPSHFRKKKWLNIFDPRDILSYVGDHEKLFYQQVQDIEVDNGQPFPESHSAYWSNQEMWNVIAKELL